MRALAWALTKRLNGNAGGNTDPACEDTVEIELSAEQMSALSRSDAAVRPPTPQTTPRENRPASVPQDPQLTWTSAVLLILVISGLSGGLALLATSPTQSVHLDVAPIAQAAAAAPESHAAPASPAEESAQVRFANPFDATEVFEFPSGTSETEARETVAGLLLQRANDRQNTWKTTRQRRKTASQVVPAAPTTLARRS